MKTYWKFFLAVLLLIAILVASLFSADFIGKQCDKIETLALSLISAAESGEKSKAERLNQEILQELERLNTRIDYTSNSFDFNNAELAYRRLWVYVEGENFEESKAEFESMRSSFIALQIADSFELPNVF